jgi:hypothetical protein
MKWFSAFLSIGILPLVSIAQSTAQQDDPALSQLVNSALHDVSTLHPGMRRSDVIRLFTEDGGLQSFGETRYDYLRCQSIKIDVKFKSASGTSNERADDID